MWRRGRQSHSGWDAGFEGYLIYYWRKGKLVNVPFIPYLFHWSRDQNHEFDWSREPIRMHQFSKPIRMLTRGLTLVCHNYRSSSPRHQHLLSQPCFKRHTVPTLIPTISPTSFLFAFALLWMFHPEYAWPNTVSKISFITRPITAACVTVLASTPALALPLTPLPTLKVTYNYISRCPSFAYTSSIDTHDHGDTHCCWHSYAPTPILTRMLKLATRAMPHVHPWPHLHLH